MRRYQEMPTRLEGATHKAQMDRERQYRLDGLPAYEMPRVLTFTDEQILAELGPAQTNIY